MTPREYITTEQLAELVGWSPSAIRRMVQRSILRRGVHVFQPLGPRSALLFKWTAVVQLIEKGTATDTAVDEATPNQAGPISIEEATKRLRRLCA